MKEIILSEFGHWDFEVLEEGSGGFVDHEDVIWFEFINAEFFRPSELHSFLIYDAIIFI